MPPPTLTDAEIDDTLASFEGWEHEYGSHHIERTLKFPTFRDAVAFVMRVAFEAEAADHHPDLDIRYNQVRVVLSSHDAGGVTEKDIGLARTIQQLAP